VGRVPAEKKIASIGVAVRHWITDHGFALNVGCNISGFEAIVPCGMSDCRMTSVSLEVGRDVSMEEAADCVAPAFAREFGCELREGDASERREFAQGRAG
jgi:lipoate-protein ligase B